MFVFRSFEALDGNPNLTRGHTGQGCELARVLESERAGTGRRRHPAFEARGTDDSAARRRDASRSRTARSRPRQRRIDAARGDSLAKPLRLWSLWMLLAH